MSEIKQAYAGDQLDTLVYDGDVRGRARAALNRYYNGSFDGGYFDSYDGNVAEPNPPYAITGVDLNAVSLLGMGRVMPRISRAFAASPSINATCSELLREIPIDAALHEVSAATIQPGSAAHELWRTIRALNGGRNGVTATKILARKRPHLLPMVDTEVYEHLGRQEDTWLAIWSWFQDPGNLAAAKQQRDSIQSPLARSGTGPLSLLRVMDVPMWMMEKGYA